MADVPSISPLAPERFPELPPVGGVRLASHAAGLRYKGRPDVMVAALDEGTTVAGVFTKSLCPSAPVDWCRRIIQNGTARAVACNAGNANAFTGAAGATSVERSAAALATALNINAPDVYLASTGVIGEPLDDNALTTALSTAASTLTDSGPDSWTAAAEAIRTTDTFAKGASAPIAGTQSNVVGIAKGSGMIAPNMATMLGFVFTDAAIPAATAQRCLSAAVAKSFNRITVDSDTSTSDTVLLFATGAAADATQDIDEAAFQAALDQVCLDLAHQIVRDGEGATKFVAATVTGAADDNAAEIIARAIADSPLVKTALAAEDANWGRIVMAVGKAGQKADRDALAIWIADEQVSADGAVLPTYSEERATEHLKGDEVSIRVDVGVGNGEATVWTCDLTHGYIDINAGYRS